MEKRPNDLICIGDIMSNLDHDIDDDAEEKLKPGDTYGYYSAWNFHGTVWFDSGKFKCQIRQYRAHVNTLEADSLLELMEISSEQYGAA